MRRALEKISAVWYFKDGQKCKGVHCNIRGDVTGIRGDVTDIRGDVTGIQGDVTDIRGDVGDCELSDAERTACVNINDLISP